jgi:hypothetical protein
MSAVRGLVMSEPYIGDPVKKAMKKKREADIVTAARKDISLSFVDLGERFGCGRNTVRRVIKDCAPEVYERLRRRG